MVRMGSARQPITHKRVSGEALTLWFTLPKLYAAMLEKASVAAAAPAYHPLDVEVAEVGPFLALKARAESLTEVRG